MCGRFNAWDSLDLAILTIRYPTEDPTEIVRPHQTFVAL